MILSLFPVIEEEVCLGMPHQEEADRTCDLTCSAPRLQRAFFAMVSSPELNA